MTDADRALLASFAEAGHSRARAGFALPGALLMILLIAALIAGVFSAITEETRIGVAAADRQIALLAAESAIEISIATGSVSLDGSVGVGQTTSRPVEGLGVPVAVYITRLDSSRFSLVADAGGGSPDSGIARRIGVVVRAINTPDGSMRIDRISERAWSELF